MPSPPPPPPPPHSSNTPHYRGHRRQSFVPLDNTETVELRARYRTFKGAYARTALLCLGFAGTVLKVFDDRFFAIGILYLSLSLLLLLLSIRRSSRSEQDFSDEAALGLRWDGPPGQVVPVVVSAREAVREQREEEIRKQGEEGVRGSALQVEEGEPAQPSISPNSTSTPNPAQAEADQDLAYPQPSRVPEPQVTAVPPTRHFGRHFVTSGKEVALVSAVVVVTEGALLGLLLSI